MRQAHHFLWETGWLFSFLSCTERDGIGLVPNSLPPPPRKQEQRSLQIHTIYISLATCSTKRTSVAVRPSCHMYDGVYF